jgi:hypothetical protein
MYEYWDIGERESFPNLGKTSTAKVMRALLYVGGIMTNSIVFGDDGMRDASRSVVYRIGLVPGTKQQFEDISGYFCTKPPIVHVN